MSKRQKFSPDFELLSAYLDGQLNPHQRSAMEARLRAEPPLLKELNTLRTTRQMIRSLPRLRAPRNFTLSAQSYPKRTPARLPAVFGGVSALASALLVMLVIGSLLQRRAAAPESVAEENIAQPVAKEVTAPVEDIALSAQTESTSAPEEPMALALPPSDDTSRNIAPTPELYEAPAAVEAAVPTTTMEEELILGIQIAPTPTPLAYDAALPRVTKGAEGGEAIPEEATAKAPEEVPTSDEFKLESTLFTGELILAGIALLSGLAALFLLIRQRR